jgi:hypothetical protein
MPENHLDYYTAGQLSLLRSRSKLNDNCSILRGMREFEWIVCVVNGNGTGILSKKALQCDRTIRFCSAGFLREACRPQ